MNQPLRRRLRQDEEQFFLGLGAKRLGKSTKRKLVECQNQITAALRGGRPVVPRPPPGPPCSPSWSSSPFPDATTPPAKRLHKKHQQPLQAPSPSSERAGALPSARPDGTSASAGFSADGDLAGPPPEAPPTPLSTLLPGVPTSTAAGTAARSGGGSGARKSLDQKASVLLGESDAVGSGGGGGGSGSGRSGGRSPAELAASAVGRWINSSNAAAAAAAGTGTKKGSPTARAQATAGLVLGGRDKGAKDRDKERLAEAKRKAKKQSKGERREER